MEHDRKPTKVCHLTSVHPRTDTRIFLKQCRSLAEHGYDVTLVVADGRGDQNVEGVRIVDAGILPGRINRMTRTTQQILKKAAALNADLYHLHDPELIPIGLKLKRLGKKVIFDIHEDTRQQILQKEYVPFAVRVLLSHIYALYEDYACTKFSALITPQKKMTLYYSNLNKTITVENFVDLSIYQRRTPDFHYPVLLHVGSLSADRGLFNMVNAAKNIVGQFEFYVAGMNNKDTASLSPLTYLGYLDQNQIVDVYRKSNIGIILFNNVGQYYMAGSTKCFEYMANSMPVIMPDFGEWIDFNREHQCGINVDVKIGKAIADIINYLICNPAKARMLGENGRRWVENRYSWQAAFEKLQVLYDEVMKS